ncbi:MAG: sulfotransferase family protein [Flavobacteriales bacterium]
MADQKIICVGFQKTGTSSLREALKILGYRVGDTKPYLLYPILRGNYNKVLKVLNKYDAVEDNPWPLIFDEIDKRVQGCKFILTERDEEHWYKSVSEHIGDLRAPMHEWIYGKGKGLPKYHKENALKIYRNHYKRVREYFKDRPNDLLILNFEKGDGWEKLCEFLNCPIPDSPFPIENKRTPEKGNKKNPVKKIRKKIKYTVLITYMRSLMKD